MKKNCIAKISKIWINFLFCFVSSVFFFHLNADDAKFVSDLKNQRIISLSPPVTEQLFLLGVGDKIIACTTYCTRPPEAEKIEKIGSLLDINLEKLISLSPDLVITSCHTKPAIIEKLKNFSIDVKIHNSPQNFKELLSQFIELGELVEKKEDAAKIASISAKKIDALKSITLKAKEKPKILFQIGAKPLYLAGKDSFVGDFISYSGATNILGELSSGVYSREMVVTENPAFIFLTTMGLLSDEEKNEWMKLDSIRAVKEGKIYLFDSYEICSPNPAELPNTLAKIAKLIHPELAEEIEKKLHSNE